MSVGSVHIIETHVCVLYMPRYTVIPSSCDLLPFDHHSLIAVNFLPGYVSK